MCVGAGEWLGVPVFVLKQDFYSKLTSCHETDNDLELPPASTSGMLATQMFTTMPGLCGAWGKTRPSQECFKHSPK